jgi:hypothetical protein
MPWIDSKVATWKKYTNEHLKADLAVGVTLAGLLLPQVHTAGST